MQSYRNTLSYDLTERSQTDASVDDTSWETFAELEAFLDNTKCANSQQSNYSRSQVLPSLHLHSTTQESAKCPEIAPRSGVFYDLQEPRSEQGSLKSEEFVDLGRYLLCDNSGERTTTRGASVKADATTEEDFDGNFYNFDEDRHSDRKFRVAGSATTTPTTNTYNNNIDKSCIITSDLKSEYTIDSDFKEYISCNNNSNSIESDSMNAPASNGGISGDGGYPSSNNTSACQSPCPIGADYYLMDVSEIKTETNLLFDFHSMLPDEKLILDYTPETSNDEVFLDFDSDVLERRQQQQEQRRLPALMLNLKGSFVSEDEINTPNIIDTIIANENHLHFLEEDNKECIKESPFLMVSPQELTSPSTSSPAAVSDTTDSFLTTINENQSHFVVAGAAASRKRGRPRKRRHDTDDEEDDETYVPPPSVKSRKRESRASVASKHLIYQDVSDDDDDDDDEDSNSRCSSSVDAFERLQAGPRYEEEVIRTGRRGRPPKPIRSVALPEDFALLNPTQAKYREMRIKNNEASRKSRFKRKVKEQEISGELDDLELENIRLKTQVDELQKTVDRYRDSLMKVMLCKK